MGYLLMVVCNVGHGNCIPVLLPSSGPTSKTALLDCGGDENAEEASKYLKALEVKTLDYLVISHPHLDHIRNIVSLKRDFSPNVLVRNRIITEQKIKDENSEVFQTHENIIQTYVDMDRSFVYPVSSSNDLTNPLLSNGAHFVNFCNSDKDLNLNNLSLVSFIVYDNHVILHSGDLEEQGWKKLLEKPDFCDMLKKTTVFIASHHGRESGYCADIFNHLKPIITIISDGRFGDTSATSRYTTVTKGMNITKKDGSQESRKVVTTRNDGFIYVTIQDGISLTIKTSI